MQTDESTDQGDENRDGGAGKGKSRCEWVPTLSCDSGANLTRRVEAALSRRLDVCGRSVSRSKESDVYVELDEDVM